ncbi:MAG: teichuronic acid biosynthesis glycosyltransferase TuaC [Pseudohongiellaceae bacterium]|jgi:teichuronic acid biosynthesis glycosyltransferase TuaC
MKITVFSGVYPSSTKPNSGLFVEKLIVGLQAKGHEITVISPRPYPKDLMQPYKECRKNIKIYYPKYINLPFSHKFSFISKIQNWFMWLNIKRIEQIHTSDLFYSHFVFPGTFLGSKASLMVKKPLVCSLGESVLIPKTMRRGYENEIKKILENVTIILCVSQKLQNQVRNLIANVSKVKYVPNGVDLSIFAPRDKKESRKHLGLPLDSKIIGFVGTLSERKGYFKILKVLESFSGKVKLAIASSQNADIKGDIVFCQSIPNEDVSVFLSALDGFVFPTNNEGMSNALLEAMACGVPIVTTNLDFNREFLNQDNSILIDNINEAELKRGVELALNTEFSSKLSLNSIRDSRKFSLKNRVENVEKSLIESLLIYIRERK